MIARLLVKQMIARLLVKQMIARLLVKQMIARSLAPQIIKTVSDYIPLFNDQHLPPLNGHIKIFKPLLEKK
jgi:hypothetical protein